ncbi:MAG: oligoendopeptidase F [Eubacteriales bacterium]
MLEPKPRKEMNPEFTWDFSHIFATKADWEAALAEAEADIETVASYKGKLTASAEALAEGLDAIYGLSEKFERVFSYASLHKEADNSDPEYQEMFARTMSVYVKFATAISFAEPEALSAGKDTLLGYLECCPALAKYRFTILDLIRSAEHVLDEKSESLLAGMSDGASAPGDAYDMLTGVDMEFPNVIGENGEELPLTGGNFGVYREHECRAVREDAFNKMFGTYKKFINTIAATYGGSVKFDCFRAKARGYASAREAALSSGNVPLSVYDSLIEAIHEALPTMKKYLALRAKVMKKEKVDMFDLYVPMVEGVAEALPYENAKELVKAACAPLGERYVQLLDEAYNNHWIDVYENKGKSTGAFSAGVYGVHPYVMLNYTDTLDDAFTLAHELGHAMHSYFSSEAQDYVNSNYRIMVAEVASTVNEVLLTKYLLKTETDPKKRAYILNHFLEGFRTTVLRQTLFAEFERESHAMCESGKPLTAQSLSALYRELVEKYYEGAEINDIIQYEWAYIPHFYRAFYVYQYATGFCSAVAIAGAIAEGGDPANYLKFLTTGGSDYPLEELKIAGVDLTKPDTVKSAMKIFDETVDELAAIL